MKHSFMRVWLHVMTLLILLGLPVAGFCQPSAWEYIGPEGGPVNAVAQDPFNANIVYIASAVYPNAIFKSTNRGAQWVNVSTVYDYLERLIIPKAAPTSLLATSYGMVYRSTDGGATWSAFPAPNSGGLYYNMYDLAVDPTNAQVIHVAAECWDGKAWKMSYLKSTTGGSTWVAKDLTTNSGCGWAVSVDPVNPLVVYVGGYTTDGISYMGALMKSVDGGASFADATSSIVGYVYSIYADETRPGRVFVGTYAGVFRSTNSGSTWSQSYIPTPYFFQVNPTNPAEVYAGTQTGVARSTNGGDTWADASKGIKGSGAGGLVLGPGTPADLLFANSSGVFRTTDAGTLWSGCNCGILAARITALQVAPSSPTNLYAAFYGNALYMTDAATAPQVPWEPLPQFYDCQNLEDLLILPTDPNVIYAMEGGG
jgi:photosystem II stability/assembly factor-like uncharacterized protein